MIEVLSAEPTFHEQLMNGILRSSLDSFINEVFEIVKRDLVSVTRQQEIGKRRYYKRNCEETDNRLIYIF